MRFEMGMTNSLNVREGRQCLCKDWRSANTSSSPVLAPAKGFVVLDVVFVIFWFGQGEHTA